MLNRIRRVPKILALVVLLIGISSGALFAKFGLGTFTGGKKISEPTSIRISNVTDSLASISWITENASSGYIKYGLAGKTLKSVAYDDKTTGDISDEYKIHHITIRGLSPESKYSFVIISQGREYKNEGKLFEFETFAVSSLSQLKPATGRVTLKNGDSATGSIVFLQLTGATLLSTLVKSDGSWVQPLNISYDMATKLPVSDEGLKKLNLYVIDPNGDEAQALIDTDHDFPAPDIVIGEKNNSHSDKPNVDVPVVLGDSSQEQDLGFVLLQPVDNQAISSSRPLIRGKGEPGQKITVVVESKPQAAVVVVDNRGNWQWTPFRDLAPGIHTVTAKTTNLQGKVITEERRFIVLKSGSQVLAESTPSASLTPSPTVIPSPTPIFSSPTPATTEGVPVSGNVTYVLLFAGLGLGLVIISTRNLLA